MKLGMIVACDLNKIIGVNGDLPWHNKTDLKRFKHLTKGHAVIMGRNTYESLPATKSGEKLPGRKKIVLSSQTKTISDEIKWVTSLEEAYDAAANCNLAWIIGGASIYTQVVNLEDVDFIDLTILNSKCQISIDDEVVTLSNIPMSYKVVAEYQNPEDELLWHRRYERRNLS